MNGPNNMEIETTYRKNVKFQPNLLNHHEKFHENTLTEGPFKNGLKHGKFI
jgi:hypothetical protein